MYNGIKTMCTIIMANNHSLEPIYISMFANICIKVLLLELSFNLTGKRLQAIEMLPPVLTELTFPSIMSN